MGRVNVALVVSSFLLLFLISPVQSSDITVVPTLPPGIFSLLSNSGTSALNTKSGTYTLGGNSTTFFLSSLLLIPLLIGVVVLDFGIFGAYATRREELNPISQFFFNIREGFNVVRNRQSSRKNTSNRERFTARYSKVYLPDA